MTSLHQFTDAAYLKQCLSCLEVVTYDADGNGKWATFETDGEYHRCSRVGAKR
jgi:hypothetical protein